MEKGKFTPKKIAEAMTGDKAVAAVSGVTAVAGTVISMDTLRNTPETIDQIIILGGSTAVAIVSGLTAGFKLGRINRDRNRSGR